MSETKKTLWAYSKNGTEIKIPILGICGEFESGKTLFAITIAPGKHPKGHPFAGLARTCVIDIEKSSENYAGMNLGFDRIDLPQQIMSIPNKKAYTSIDLYEEFRKSALAIPDGRYDVLIVDPVTDIDSGLTEYVRNNLDKFGLTNKQVDKMSGLLWGVVKEEWNKLLLLLSTKCKTFCFTAHMRDLFVGNTPSGKREPKGKETLAKLATLYLELQRKPKNGIVPSVPIGIRLKSRICDTVFDEKTGDITTIELLPKVIENCTPAHIRNLIESSKPVTSAAYSEDHLTEDMRLAFQVEMQSKRAEANNAELELANVRNKCLEGMQRGLPAANIPSNEVRTGSYVSATVKEAPKETEETPEPPEPPFNVPETPKEPQDETSIPAEKTEKPKKEKATKKTAKPDNPMWDGNAEFPPEAYSRETEINTLKIRLSEGYFTKDDLAAALQLYKVAKVSEMSDPALESFIAHVRLTKQVIDEAVKRNIPRLKLEEFAGMANEKSFFVSSIETKQKMLELIMKQALPSSEGNA
jgi:hypothetical protein